MYKTLWQMWSDSEVANSPYRGGSFIWLVTLITRQKIADGLQKTMFSEKQETDLDRYAYLNSSRLEAIQSHRAAMHLRPLTPEDISESPESSRYIWEDPMWMSALRDGKLSYVQLDLKVSDLEQMWYLDWDSIVQ